MTFPVIYERATGPSGGPQPGAKAILGWATDTYPAAYNLGIYNPRRVRGSKNAWSIHAEGRAVDIGFPVVTPKGHPEGIVCAQWLVDNHKALGVQQIIWAKRIWRNTKHSQGWRDYRGTSPHFDHVHMELTRQAGRELTRSMIDAIAAGHSPALPKDDTLLALITEASRMVRDFYEAATGSAPDPVGGLYWNGLIDLAAAKPDPNKEIHKVLYVLATQLGLESQAEALAVPAGVKS